MALLPNELFVGGVDHVVVGAGLSGSVVAQQAAERSGWKVLVIEKRNHLGGNCYDFIDEHGIRVSKYGAHIFHTRHQRVWKYVRRFSQWVPYQHRVLGRVRHPNGSFVMVPIPPNQDTVNVLYGTNLTSEAEMQQWIQMWRPDLQARPPNNGEEMSLSRVGRRLYEQIFKHYTFKQWAKYPAELDASVLARLPFRLDNNPRYFNDPWEALPRHGFDHFFRRMLLSNPLITVRLNVDYFKVKAQLPRCRMLVFTGPIDAFYAGRGLPKLEYRSIRFEKEYHEPDGGFYQPSWVVNYPGAEVNWTRIVEYKHTPNQPWLSGHNTQVKGTVIFREYSTSHGEPYYPVPNESNQNLYAHYQQLTQSEPNVLFVGRLASYKYFNMDEAILAALTLYDQLHQNLPAPTPKNKNQSSIPGCD